MSNRFKRLFWTADPARDAPPPAPAPAPALAPAGPAGPRLVRPPAPGEADELAAIYARTDTVGDPRVDQMLSAFAGMQAAMPAPQLAVAMTATATAIGAGTALVVDTLTRRLGALDAAIADEQRTTAERQAGRRAQLATTTAAAHAEIKAMEARIAALRDQLAAATASVHDHDARELEALAGLDQRARAEAARLRALRDFLAPPGARAAKSA